MLEALAKKFADMDLTDMNIGNYIDCNKASVLGNDNFIIFTIGDTVGI